MKKSFSKTIAVLLAVLMVVCSLPMTVFAAGESRSNVQLQFGTYFASGAATHQTYVDENYSGFGDSGLKTAKLDYNKATGTITEASSGHTYGIGDFFTVSVLLENTSSLAATQVGIKYSDNIVPAAVGENEDGFTALLPATEVTSPADGFAPNEAITSQSGNAIYNTASSTVGEISYIDADKKTMWANFAVQDGTDAVNLTAPKTVGVNTFTNTAVIATFGFKIVGEGAVTFSLADSKDIDSAYYVETIANGGKVEEYKTYTQTDYDGSTALDFMNNNENIESTKYTVKFVREDGTVISEAQYTEGATVTVPDLPKAEKISDTQHNTYAWDPEPALTATADATYTAVPTPEDHKWDAGVKQNDGSTLYTCTTCGATKSEAGHVHSYTWKYNGDAYYNTKNDRKDGTMTGTCTCGDTVTKTVPGTSLLRPNSYSLILDNSLTINFKMTKANVSSFNNIVVKANTKFGPQQVFESPTKDDGVTYQYAIGLPPQYVKDDIELVAYSTYEGVEVWGPTYGRSVLTYVNSKFNDANITGDNASNKNKAFRTMLVNILNYATAAQKKINYDTANLANAGLTEAQKAWASPDIQSFNTVKNYDAVTIDNPTARFAAGGLKLEDAVVPRMTFALKEGTVDIKDITLEATVGGKTFTYTQADNPEAFQFYKTASGKLGTENRYYFYFTDILANQMSETITFQIKVNGKAVSNVCTYSVESYVNQMYPTANEIDKDLYMTMMQYGTSAVAYGRA